MTAMTDTRIFEIEYVCVLCNCPIADGPVAKPHECHHVGTDVRPRSYRYFLADALDVRNVHCIRHDAGALVDIEQRWVVHSPTGFEWGYGGSGPADLALNVLGLVVPPQEAWRLHQSFKSQIIAKLPRDRATIDMRVVRAWVRRQWLGESE